MQGGNKVIRPREGTRSLDPGREQGHKTYGREQGHTI